ncbi:MAG TPA: hypothetical protein VNT02_13800, partial [Burkholderiales bacterium]|nr:hypothetical protein [Burkholderiales bacterium]
EGRRMVFTRRSVVNGRVPSTDSDLDNDKLTMDGTESYPNDAKASVSGGSIEQTRLASHLDPGGQ